MVQRVRRARYVESVVVATPPNKDNSPIWDMCIDNDIQFSRPASVEDDVLGRVALVHAWEKSDLAVLLTGDCPLIDPDVIDRAICLVLESGVDYVSNCRDDARTFFRGQDVQAVRTSALLEVDANIEDQRLREHSGLWWRENTCNRIDMTTKNGGHEVTGLTLDTQEDYEKIRDVFEALYPTNPEFTMQEVLSYVRGRETEGG
jgi:spore coat polysaccharide biosynthesis protein SpsF